jgi:hypothetical protein
MTADPQYEQSMSLLTVCRPLRSMRRALRVCSPFSTRRRSSKRVSSHLNLGNAAMFRLSGGSPQNSNSRVSILVSAGNCAQTDEHRFSGPRTKRSLDQSLEEQQLTDLLHLVVARPREPLSEGATDGNKSIHRAPRLDPRGCGSSWAQPAISAMYCSGTGKCA